jgi:branched-subunit amino acid transport protein
MRDVMIISLIGGGTLAMRALFIVGSFDLPSVVERIMRHAKPAILAALVGGSLIGGDGQLAARSVAALTLAWFMAKRGLSVLSILAAAVAVATLLPG